VEVPAHEQLETAYDGAVAKWHPAQLIPLVIGAAFTIMGIMGVMRADDVNAHVRVWGLDHTRLLGFIEIAFGALSVLAGLIPNRGYDTLRARTYDNDPSIARGLTLLLGFASLAFGLYVFFQHEALHPDLGTHPGHGWLYTLVGAGLILAAMAMRRTWEGRDVVIEERRYSAR
jgi:hypothetical protein